MNTVLRCATSVTAGNGLGTTAKYLLREGRGAAGNGRRNDQVPAMHNERRCGQRLVATIKFLREAASTGLSTTIKYLRGAAGIGRETRSSTCNAQRAAPRASACASRSSFRETHKAPPRATAWATRSTTFAAPRATAGRSDQVSSTHNERCRGQRPENHDK
jgi:hypothetical protein